jgi:hypothetical protein
MKTVTVNNTEVSFSCNEASKEKTVKLRAKFLSKWMVLRQHIKRLYPIRHIVKIKKYNFTQGGGRACIFTTITTKPPYNALLNKHNTLTFHTS